MFRKVLYTSLIISAKMWFDFKSKRAKIEVRTSIEKYGKYELMLRIYSVFTNFSDAGITQNLI